MTRAVFENRRGGSRDEVGQVRRVDSGAAARSLAGSGDPPERSGPMGRAGDRRRPPVPVTSSQPVAPPADRFPRLLAGIDPSTGPIDLQGHLSLWGPLDVGRARADLIDQLEVSGLAGHGGAWFPVAAKWRSVAFGRRRPVVVANGVEGEPASAKDGFLLDWAPHLVIDGASAAAATLGAERVILYVPARLAAAVAREVASRRRLVVDPVEVEVVPAVEAFVAGQESAVVNALEGRAAVPSFVTLRPIRLRGVGRRPTLVQNVETLAHVGLIARFGGRWFRGLGTQRDPGTMLLTLHDGAGPPQVIEAPLGIALCRALQLPSTAAADFQAALVGGYGSGWVSMTTLSTLELSESSARRHGVALGPGIVALLPGRCCPVGEVARVVRYMEGQSAGQCGPCVRGLGALADALESLAFDRRPARGILDRVRQLCDLVEGRGACRHPDGVARFVRSSLSVFEDDMTAHVRHGPCDRAGRPSVLPVPGMAAPRGPAGRDDRPMRPARQVVSR